MQHRSHEGSPSKLKDRVILVLASLIVCVLLVAAFWLGDIYRVNPGWVFFGWNSILLIPLVGKEFRSLFKKPSFIAFFLGWMILHGSVVVALMKWVDGVYWLPILGVELFLGYFVAYSLFDLQETQRDGQEPDTQPHPEETRAGGRPLTTTPSNDPQR